MPTYPTYPATTASQAEELLIFTANQMSNVVNADATSEIETVDGPIPSLRKSLADNFYFLDPIDWVGTESETEFNQLRKFTDGTWWFAPTATDLTPVLMDTTPIGDTNWKMWSRDQQTVYENAKRLAAEAGYTMTGSFYIGGTVSTTTEVLLNPEDGRYYSWDGALPKTVLSGTTPQTTGGIGAGFWLDKSGDLLKTTVDINSSDISTLQTDVSNIEADKADLDSPTFTGTPAAPTATFGIETTQIATTAFVQQELKKRSWQGKYHKLTASCSGVGYAIIASVDSLVVGSAENTDTKQLTSVSISVDGAVSGVNGLDTGTISAGNWYYLYVIYNPATSTTSGLLSLSPSSPTLPVGYTLFARISSAYIVTATSKFRIMNQINNVVSWNKSSASKQVQILSAGAATTTTAVATTTAIPPTASSFIVASDLTTINNTASAVYVYSDSGGRDLVSSSLSNGVTTSASIGEVVYYTANVYYKVFNGTYTGNVYVYGYKDNI